MSNHSEHSPRDGSRRRFISHVSRGAIGAWALNLLSETSSARFIVGTDSVAPSDEQFWSTVRAQFPLTHDRIYFNNGTIGPSPLVVIDAMKHAIDDLDSRGEYDGWETARPKIAHLINADPSEISLTHNTTEGINIIASGLPLKRGDEVIITTHEHAGNALPWINRAHIDGIMLRVFQPALTAEENLDRINALINRNTRAIAIPHITCTTGVVFPVKEIATLGHEKGLWVLFDGAHGPGTLALDVKDLGCDFYAACGHKWMCGPRGTGFLYVRKELLDVVQARWIGAYSDLGWDLTVEPPQFKGYVPTAHRFDFGTQSAPLSIGLAAAADFLEKIGIDNISRRSHALATFLQDELLKLGDKIEMLTPTEVRSRGAMVGFRLKNLAYDTFGEQAAKNHFRIRLVPESHLNSVRISTHLYNNFEEVEKFIDFVRKVA